MANRDVAGCIIDDDGGIEPGRDAAAPVIYFASGLSLGNLNRIFHTRRVVHLHIARARIADNGQHVIGHFLSANLLRNGSSRSGFSS